MSCMLRAVGSKKSVLELQKLWNLKNVSYYIKGQKRFPQSQTGPLNSYSGIGVLVSDAGFERLDLQIKDAIRYLKKHQKNLEKLSDLRFKEIKIDFGIEKREVWAQFDYFPPSLLRFAGNLNIGIEISQYETAESKIKAKSKKGPNKK